MQDKSINCFHHFNENPSYHAGEADPAYPVNIFECIA